MLLRLLLWVDKLMFIPYITVSLFTHVALCVCVCISLIVCLAVVRFTGQHTHGSEYLWGVLLLLGFHLDVDRHLACLHRSS
jgi:hypothetical protein